jgi:hypothetical protein
MKHEISEGKMLGSSAIPNEKQISIPLEVEGKFEGTAKEMCIETTKTDDDALRAPLMRTSNKLIPCELEPEGKPTLEKSWEVRTRIPTDEPKFGLPNVQPVSVNT